MKYHVAIAVLLLSGLLAGVACSNEAGEAPSARIEIRMRDIAFEPAGLKLRAGQPVGLALRNEGSLVHDFTIREMPRNGLQMSGGMRSGGHAHAAEALAVHLAFEAGGKGEVRFTPTRPGTYAYYCTVPGHREAGMEGSLEVTE